MASYPMKVGSYHALKSLPNKRIFQDLGKGMEKATGVILFRNRVVYEIENQVFVSSRRKWKPMEYCCFLLFLLLINAMGFSQDYQISGKVTDKETGDPLEAATIYTETIRDSTLLSYTISDKNGLFELDLDTRLSNVNLFITYNGYITLTKQVQLDTPVINLSELALQVQRSQLEEVSVVGERVPISVKKDTLEFNANSFSTRPDATVEDLLKKLPGVVIGADSKITVNGVEVDQILVNGQAFFSNDPNIATKGLSKEIIDQVQITSTKTETERFMGEQGRGGTKTINLTIKEDRNRGYLGRLSAAYGTDERYQANGLLNYFNNTERTSLLASFNNVNNPGFSFNEISDMAGSTGFLASSAGGGQGITTSANLGTSYANTKKDVYDINGDYFFAYANSFDDQKTVRENVLPDGRFFTDSESSFEGTTYFHRSSANLQFDIDKTLQVFLNPTIDINRTNSLNIASTVSTDEEGNSINENETRTETEGRSRNFSNRLTLLKKLGARGEYIGFTFFNTNQTQTDISRFNSRRTIFGDMANEEILDQRTEVDNTVDSYGLQFTYRQPLAEKLFLDLGYRFENNKQTNSRFVFDVNEGTAGHTDLNESLSSDFSFTNTQQSPSLALNRNGEQLQFGITARYILTELDNEDFLQNTSFSKTYENALFSAFANYNFGKNKNMSLGYNTNLRIPSVDQLQPVPNLNNPLNIIVGNPDLDPTVSHGINFGYNDYNWQERTGFFLYAQLQILQDKVVDVTITDENFLRTTTYTNIDGNYTGTMALSFSREIKKDSIFSAVLNLNTSFNHSRDVSFNNDQRLIALSYGLNPSIGGTFNFRELVELEPGYGLSFNASTYNVDGFEDIDFVSHIGFLRTTTYWPKNIVWSNDINYTYNSNVGPGFDRDAIFWNMSLGLQLFNKQSILKVLAYDLLNQNINTRRTTGLDYVQDFQGTVLQQYFMLSFTHKFNRFGKKM